MSIYNELNVFSFDFLNETLLNMIVQNGSRGVIILLNKRQRLVGNSILEPGWH